MVDNNRQTRQQRLEIDRPQKRVGIRKENKG